MSQYDRTLWKAASALQQAYADRSSDPVELPQSANQLRHLVDLVTEQQRRRRRASQLGFSAAANLARRRLARMTADLYTSVAANLDALRRDRPKPPDLGSLYAELVAAKAQFGAVGFGDNIIWVTTDYISLEGVELGRFELRLHLDTLSQVSNPMHAVSISALDPNCPDGHDDVTHPHVRDEMLCPGDADVPIHAALREGRLSDLWNLISSVLHTYNSDSPFVELEAWYGRTCDECGYRCPHDEYWMCECCNRVLCDECNYSCIECGYIYCRSCMLISDISEEWVCTGCMIHCAQCGCVAASGELEAGLCPECLEEHQSDESLEDEQEQYQHVTPTSSTEDREAGAGESRQGLPASEVVVTAGRAEGRRDDAEAAHREEVSVAGPHLLDPGLAQVPVPLSPGRD